MRQHIKIEGMGCDHCVTAVRKALEKVHGLNVEHVEIGTAVVELDPGANVGGEIEDVIRAAGYEPVSRVEA